jgi:hypothetical protein
MISGGGGKINLGDMDQRFALHPGTLRALKAARPPRYIRISLKRWNKIKSPFGDLDI